MLAKLYYCSLKFYTLDNDSANKILGDCGLAANLISLGFQKGVVAEAILSTYSASGEANAAPMGITLQDDEHLTVDLFNSSQTYRNVKTNRCAVVNLTKDIAVFYRSAFKEANPNGKLPPEWFERAKLVNAPKLSFADATIEVSVEHLELMETKGAMKTRATFKVESIWATCMFPQAHSRALSLTIEAIVAATRVKVYLHDQKQQLRLAKLLEVISDCHQVVNRVAPNSVYTQVMDDLTQRVESWRKPK